MRSDLERLGGWDTAYAEPAYYGDNDLCWRAKQAGMGLVELTVGLKHLTNCTTNDDVGQRARASGHNRQIYEQRVRAAHAPVA
jgi:GT2 family glycosyltransferase